MRAAGRAGVSAGPSVALWVTLEGGRRAGRHPGASRISAVSGASRKRRVGAHETGRGPASGGATRREWPKATSLNFLNLSGWRPAFPEGPRGCFRGLSEPFVKGLILAQNERWRRGLGMQVARARKGQWRKGE